MAHTKQTFILRVFNNASSTLKHYPPSSQAEGQTVLTYDKNATVIQEKGLTVRILQAGSRFIEIEDDEQWSSKIEELEVQGSIYSTRVLYNMILNFQNLKQISIYITKPNPKILEIGEVCHQINIERPTHPPVNTGITMLKIFVDLAMYKKSGNEKQEILISLCASLLQMAKNFRSLDYIRLELPADEENRIYGATYDLIQNIKALKNKGEIRVDPGNSRVSYNYPPHGTYGISPMEKFVTNISPAQPACHLDQSLPVKPKLEVPHNETELEYFGPAKRFRGSQ